MPPAQPHAVRGASPCTTLSGSESVSAPGRLYASLMKRLSDVASFAFGGSVSTLLAAVWNEPENEARPGVQRACACSSLDFSSRVSRSPRPCSGLPPTPADAVNRQSAWEFARRPMPLTAHSNVLPIRPVTAACPFQYGRVSCTSDEERCRSFVALMWMSSRSIPSAMCVCLPRSYEPETPYAVLLMSTFV